MIDTADRRLLRLPPTVRIQHLNGIHTNCPRLTCAHWLAYLAQGGSWRGADDLPEVSR